MNNHFGGAISVLVNVTSCGLNLTSRKLDLTKTIPFTSN